MVLHKCHLARLVRQFQVFHRSRSGLINSFNILFHRKRRFFRFLLLFLCLFFTNTDLFQKNSKLPLSFPQGCGKPVWKSVENGGLSKTPNLRFFQKITENLLTKSQTRQLSGSCAMALRSVAEKCPARYSKYPAAATIAPLSPHSERGGTHSFAPFFLQTFSKRARR